MASKRDTFAQAAAELHRLAEVLKSQSRAQLMDLVESPTLSNLQLDGRKFQLGAWAELREADRLSVVAEIRRNLWLGTSKVHAEGFFLEADGRITPMVDRDLWDHGY